MKIKSDSDLWAPAVYLILFQVEVDCEEPSSSPKTMIDLLDKPSQQQLVWQSKFITFWLTRADYICISVQLNSTNVELRGQEKRGILWLLDEESLFPGATDESFMERLFVHYGGTGEWLFLNTISTEL